MTSKKSTTKGTQPGKAKGTATVTPKPEPSNQPALDTTDSPRTGYMGAYSPRYDSRTGEETDNG